METSPHLEPRPQSTENPTTFLAREGFLGMTLEQMIAKLETFQPGDLKYSDGQPVDLPAIVKSLSDILKNSDLLKQLNAKSYRDILASGFTDMGKLRTALGAELLRRFPRMQQE